MFVQGQQTRSGEFHQWFLGMAWLPSQPQKLGGKGKGDACKLLSAYPFPHGPNDPEGTVEGVQRRSRFKHSSRPENLHLSELTEFCNFFKPKLPKG